MVAPIGKGCVGIEWLQVSWIFIVDNTEYLAPRLETLEHFSLGYSS